ncbi:hypothetical protein TRFO_23449 [Tritrichomonas foetus]|uniref:Protein kinase domain-containing protein n=1 Tax=Tritrichomonas foetus TaxID=1144522 RepID=A0A1J4KB23_9EUKA|nr:hypothetical protein TRFO_23449 [Tritrichomonas foetus]|eukprot:OHT08162.1 hypothetical protein TRFO_23449 [Tritrichomonas foetus]
MHSQIVQLKRNYDDYQLRIKRLKSKIIDLNEELRTLRPKPPSKPKILGESQYEGAFFSYKWVKAKTKMSNYLLETYQKLLQKYGIDEEFFPENENDTEILSSTENLSIKGNNRAQTTRQIQAQILFPNSPIMKTRSIYSPAKIIRYQKLTTITKTLPSINVTHLNTQTEAAKLAEANKKFDNIIEIQRIIYKFFDTIDGNVIADKIARISAQNRAMEEEERELKKEIRKLDNSYAAIQTAAEDVEMDIKGAQRMIEEGSTLMEEKQERIIEENQNIKELLMQNRMIAKGIKRIGTLFEIESTKEGDVAICSDILKQIVTLFKKSHSLVSLVKTAQLTKLNHKSNFQVVDSTSSSRRLISINDYQQPPPFNTFNPSVLPNNLFEEGESNELPSITALASSSNIINPLNSSSNMQITALSSTGNLQLTSLSSSSNLLNPLASNSNMLVPGLALGSISMGSSSNLLLPGIPLSSAKGKSDFFPGTRISRRAFSAMNSMRVTETTGNDVDQELQLVGNMIGHIFVERFSPQFTQFREVICPMEIEEPQLKFDPQLEQNLDSYSTKKIINSMFDLYKRFRAYLYLLVFDNYEINQIDQSFLNFLSQRNQYIDAFVRNYDNDILMKEFTAMILVDENASIWLIRDLVTLTDAVDLIPIIYQKVSPLFQRKHNQITLTIDNEYASLFVPWAALFATFLNIKPNPAIQQSLTVMCTENITMILPALSRGKNSSANRAGLTALFQLGCHLPHLFHSEIAFQSKATSFMHNYLRSSLNFPTCVKTATDLFISCHRFLDEDVLMWHTAVFFNLIMHEIVRFPLREVNLNCYLSVMTVIVANRQKFIMEQLGKLYFLPFLICSFKLEESVGQDKKKQQQQEQQQQAQQQQAPQEPSVQNEPGKPPPFKLPSLNLPPRQQPLINQQSQQTESNANPSTNESDQASKKPMLSLLPLNADLKKVSYLDLPSNGLPSLNLENPKLQLHFQPVVDINLQKTKSISITLNEYIKMRRKYPIYLSKDVHVHYVQLMFATLIDHSLHRLDVYFCDPFPQVNRKPNVLFTLMKHMESKYNEDISELMEEVFTPPKDVVEIDSAHNNNMGLIPLMKSERGNHSNRSKIEPNQKLNNLTLEKSNSATIAADTILESVEEEGSHNSHNSSNVSAGGGTKLSKAPITLDEQEDTFSLDAPGPTTSLANNLQLMSFKSVPNFIASASEDIIESSLRHSSRDELLTKYREDQKAQFQDYQRLLRMTVPNLFHPEGYSNGQHIASGAFGAVMAVTLNDVLYAVKVLEKSRNELDNPHLIEVYTEVSILEVCKGDRRVTQLIDYGCTADSYYIVQEFYPSTMKGWRKKYIARNEKPPEAMLIRIYREFLQACTVLTDHRINHFDIKCDNVMLDRDGYPALADFGEAMCYKNELNCFTLLNKGTEWIKSPEMLSIALNSSATNPNYDRRKRVGAGPASDIWSIGCLFFELMTGDFLFLDSDWSRFFLRITDPKKKLLNEENLAALDHNQKYISFLEFVLQRSVRHRPDLQQVIVKFDEMFPDAMNGPLPKLEMPVFQNLET